MSSEGGGRDDNKDVANELGSEGGGGDDYEDVASVERRPWMQKGQCRRW